jgi:outer membrane protein assembly factor BamA
MINLFSKRRFVLAIIFIYSLNLFSNEDNILKIRKIILQSDKPIPVNKYISQLDIKSGDEFDQGRANENSKKLRNMLYRDQRYNVKVMYPELQFLSGNQIDIVYKIQFFEQIKIQNLDFIGNRYFSSSKLKKLAFGDNELNLNPNQLSSKLFDIIRIYSERQFLFATAELDSLIYEEDSYRAVVRINEGKKANFTDYKFQGNNVTTENTLLRISGLNQIENLTRNKLLQVESRILKKNYIDNCELIPLDEKTLLVKIKEGRMTRISTLLGYSDNSNNDGFTGMADLKLLNLFGTDRTFGLYWNRPNEFKTRIEMNYRDPGFEIIPIGFGIALSRESSDSLYVQSEAELSLDYERFYYSLGVIGSYDSFYPVDFGYTLYKKTNRNKLGIKGSWDNTDYFLNPTSGNQLKVQFSKIWANSEDENYENEEVFTEMMNYYGLSQSWVTAIGVNAKYSSKRDLLDIYQYKLGGNKNLRGFFEDQFQGTRVGWATIELRYLLNFKSRVFIFCDYGYTEYEDNEVLFKNDDLVGLGLGFRIDTRLGILKLDYAFGHSNGEWQNPMQGYIHIGIDTEF